MPLHLPSENQKNRLSLTAWTTVTRYVITRIRTETHMNEAWEGWQRARHRKLSWQIDTGYRRMSMWLILKKIVVKLYIKLIFVPTPLEGGGEELCTQMGFFVQSILADRYIHRRELRLVSLESLSSVEYGFKKIFLIFVFDREISRFKLSRK